MTTATLNETPNVPALRLKDDSEVRSPFKMAATRFIHNKLAVAGLVIALFIAFVALGADFLAPFDPKGQSNVENSSPGYIDPTFGRMHVLGTDDLGRDIQARLMYGARISLMVPIVVEAVVVLIGVPLGLIAGYFGGVVDDVVMRFTDIMFAFPGLLLVIILVSIYGRSLWTIFIALGVASWPTMTRLVRGQVLQIKEMDYVLGARSIGAGSFGLMLRHIIPNILGPIIVLVTLDFPGDIISEATLSFLGLGVDPSTPTWGTMVSTAYQGINSYAFETVVPAAAIATLTLALSFVGDGMRDAFDPRMSTAK